MTDFPSCNEGKTQADKIKRVQSFFGLFSYYRKHTSGFSKKALPLILLIKKGQPFVWGKDQQDSFDQLKTALLSTPILAHPNYTLPMIILPDACGMGIGAVLSQKFNEKELQNQLKPTAMENENIEIITTPIAEPLTGTEKNRRHSFTRPTTTGGHSNLSQQSREYNNTTPCIRRCPGYLHFLVTFHFMLLLFTIGPSTSAVLLRDTVIFQEQPGIAMSESSWKLVMDWTGGLATPQNLRTPLARIP